MRLEELSRLSRGARRGQWDFAWLSDYPSSLAPGQYLSLDKFRENRQVKAPEVRPCFPNTSCFILEHFLNLEFVAALFILPDRDLEAGTLPAHYRGRWTKRFCLTHFSPLTSLVLHLMRTEQLLNLLKHKANLAAANALQSRLICLETHRADQCLNIYRLVHFSLASFASIMLSTVTRVTRNAIFNKENITWQR